MELLSLNLIPGGSVRTFPRVCEPRLARVTDLGRQTTNILVESQHFSRFPHRLPSRYLALAQRCAFPAELPLAIGRARPWTGHSDRFCIMAQRFEWPSPRPTPPSGGVRFLTMSSRIPSHRILDVPLFIFRLTGFPSITLALGHTEDCRVGIVDPISLVNATRLGFHYPLRLTT